MNINFPRNVFNHRKKLESSVIFSPTITQLEHPLIMADRCQFCLIVPASYALFFIAGDICSAVTKK